MPGKRFDLRITRGAYTNARARLISASKHLPNAALLEIQNATTFDGARLTVDYPWDWIERIPQKSTRARKGQIA